LHCWQKKAFLDYIFLGLMPNTSSKSQQADYLSFSLLKSLSLLLQFIQRHVLKILRDKNERKKKMKVKLSFFLFAANNWDPHISVSVWLAIFHIFSSMLLSPIMCFLLINLAWVKQMGWVFFSYIFNFWKG
jgi:hypothetical protein